MSGPIAVGVVAQVGPVGGADLVQPGAGGGDQVGQPEAGADLDQLAAADDDLAAGGQRGRGQHQRGRAVVDDQRVLRGRDSVEQGAQRRRAPRLARVPVARSSSTST